VFSNQIKSPLYLAKNEKDKGLKLANVDLSEPTKSIYGDHEESAIKKIIFQSEEESDLLCLVASDDNTGQTIQLEDGEEIIGLYGNKDSRKWFINLGFIVWKPVFNY